MLIVHARNTQAHLGPKIWVNSMPQGLNFHLAQVLNPNL